MTSIYKRVRKLGFNKFERRTFCEQQNELLLKRLAKYERGAYRNYADTLRWGDKSNPLDGDWVACRAYRAPLIFGAYGLLKGQLPLVFLTFAHPYWRVEVGALDTVDVSTIKQLVYRRLRAIGTNVLAVGAFEFRLSVELNGSVFWEGHIHLVISGATKTEVRKAFKKYRGKHKRYAKPMKVLPVGHLPTRLGYCVKRVVKQHIAFVGKKGVNRRKLPLPLMRQIEMDLWLLSLPAASRVILYGLRMHGHQLCSLHKRERRRDAPPKATLRDQNSS